MFTNGYFFVSICFIVLGLFEQNDYNSGSSIGIGLVLLVSGVALFFILGKNSFLFSYSHNQLQKQWSEYYAQRNKVNIILIPEEFILKTKDSEKAYTWKALKSLDEYSTGFIIYFFSEYRKFIPKSVFSNESEINEFKQLVKQYKSK